MADPDAIRAIGVLFIILPTVVAGCRFWARSFVKARLGADDWLIVPALVFNLLTGIALIQCANKGGLGAHMMPPMTPDGKSFIFTEIYRQFGIWKWLVQVLGTVTVTCTKLSVLFLYRRIFDIKWFRMVCNVWIGITTAWGIAFILTLIFQCDPVSAFWSNYEWLAASYCIEQLKFYLGITVSDLICDVITIFLPIPVLWRLQMPVKTKIATVGIFLLGGVVCAAGAVRLAAFFTTPINSLDVTYNEAGTLYWTYIEGAVAIIGACLPTLRPLFRSFFKVGSTTKGYSTGRKSTHDRSLNGHGSFSQLRGDESRQEDRHHVTTMVTTGGRASESLDDIPMQVVHHGTGEKGGIRTEKTWNTTYSTK